MKRIQKRAKRHHIVPITLQQHFIASEEKLWFSEKNTRRIFSKPELRKPKSAFHERNRFTILLDDKPSDIVETSVFAKLDNILGALVPQFIETVRSGSVPQMDDAASQMVKQVITSLATRSPDFMETESDEELGMIVLKNTLELLPLHPSYLTERLSVIEKLNDRELQRQYGRDVRTRGTISPTPRSSAALREYDFRWASISAKQSFILSSKMVYRLGNGMMNGIANPLTEIWMPISPKIAIVLLRDPNGQIPNINQPTAKLVRDLNVYAAKNSTMVASHSEALLKSVINPK